MLHEYFRATELCSGELLYSIPSHFPSPALSRGECMASSVSAKGTPAVSTSVKQFLSFDKPPLKEVSTKPYILKLPPKEKSKVAWLPD